jgi:hypothetical protein
MGQMLVLWTEAAEEADGEQQADLRHQHPASPATEAGQAEAVEQRRPEEFPGVGELDQREEADGLQVDALAAQPGGQQVEQQVERQARKKPVKMQISIFRVSRAASQAGISGCGSGDRPPGCRGN